MHTLRLASPSLLLVLALPAGCSAVNAPHGVGGGEGGATAVVGSGAGNTTAGSSGSGAGGSSGDECDNHDDCSGVADAWCSDGYCLPKGEKGAACTEHAGCLSGFCAEDDGVCCDSACDQVCEACTAAKTGSPDGTCAPVSADTDPDDECDDAGVESCGTNGFCSGSEAACAVYPQGTECAPATCTNGEATTASACDENGTCGGSTTTSCGAYACGSGACLSTCTTDVDCAAGYACLGGQCVETCLGPLTPAGTIQLAANWSAGVHGNFHPQGMGYDASDGNLVLSLQRTSKIHVVSLAGALVKTVSVSEKASHMTGIAADASYYYYSDYSGNSSGLDLFRVGKGGGVPTQISSGKAAYGGFPIAVGNGKLYRGKDSTSYDWTNINQIRVSDVDTPDSVTATWTLPIARGIGDIAVAGGTLWVLAYAHAGGNNRSADLYRIDPATGAILETHTNVYNPGSPYYPSGLAYAQGHLYVFNYSEQSNTGSTLTKLACQ